MMKFQMSTYYFFFFFGMGVTFPLMGIYFDEIGLSGSQLGVIMAVGPVIAIVAQPIWGMICDHYNNPKKVLIIITFMSSILGLGFVLSDRYIYLIIVAALLSVFQSAIIPISDSMTISYVKKYGGEYGSIRLWGAVSFALAVWIAGMMIEITFTGIIFYIFSVSLLFSTFFAMKMPNEADHMHVNIRVGLKQLLKIPSYILFLISTFLIRGPILASIYFFGIYYVSLGGSVAGVGLFFLLAAIGEATFMKLAGLGIRKVGVVLILITASVFSIARSFFYYFEPNTTWVLLTSLIHGLTIGLFIPAAIHLVRELTPDNIKVTGMSIFSSVANGLGVMVFTFIAGVIYEYYSLSYMYLFFGYTSTLGVFFLAIVFILYIRR